MATMGYDGQQVDPLVDRITVQQRLGEARVRDAAGIPPRAFTCLVASIELAPALSSISAGGWRRSGFLEGSSGNAWVW
jgi:hypothetical protein